MTTLESHAIRENPAMTMPDDRVGELTRDRLCVKCCFNLSGQTIVREPHYGLLMVRCPECGTPAALQEYPALGRWGARVGFAAAAVWFGAMVLLVFASAGAVWGQSNELLRMLASPYTAHIQQAWTAFATEEAKKVQTTGTTAAPAWSGYYNAGEEKKWLEAQTPGKLFQEAGGWWHGAIAWNAVWDILSAAILFAVLGSMLAVCAPHLRMRGRILLALTVIVLGGAMEVVDWMASTTYWWGYSGYYVGNRAQVELWPYLVPGCVLACGVLYVMGVCVGRAIARRTVVLLLPPRLRGPLAFLWIADGKTLPRPKP